MYTIGHIRKQLSDHSNRYSRGNLLPNAKHRLKVCVGNASVSPKSNDLGLFNQPFHFTLESIRHRWVIRVSKPLYDKGK